jgi:transcriptional regulator with XRE-family HTH domain
MTEISDNNWIALSDKALLETMGEFIRHHRLQQNKSQSLLAKEAGIARSTLSLVEKGESTLLIVYIQLLRALDLLYLLKEFQVKQQYSPLQLAKLDQSKRIRAKKAEKKSVNPKSNW